MAATGASVDIAASCVPTFGPDSYRFIEAGREHAGRQGHIEERIHALQYQDLRFAKHVDDPERS